MKKKKNYEILVLTALTVGTIWTILELTPKSALLSLTTYTVLKSEEPRLFFPFLNWGINKNQDQEILFYLFWF